MLCPHCATFAREVQPWLAERDVHAGQVRFIYPPAPFLGDASVQAHATADCVAEQGPERVWRSYDRLFALGRHLPWWKPEPTSCPRCSLRTSPACPGPRWQQRPWAFPCGCRPNGWSTC
ncbi:MAG: thioredoxin domain-containing protein [Firmicutes bacterium]|nr:thioredoxin domain-containing protein [Bacillota bacterium]